MFSDRDIPYGGIYPGTGVQQEASKVGPKASTLGLVVSQRWGGIYPGTGFQQEAPKVGPKASTLGLVVSQRNVQ